MNFGEGDIIQSINSEECSGIVPLALGTKLRYSLPSVVCVTAECQSNSGICPRYILRSHQLTCHSWYHSWTQPAPVLCISICCCLFLCPDHMHKILMTHSDSIFWFAIPGLPLKLKDLHTPSLLASFIRIDEIVLQFPTIPKPQSLNRFISH